MTTDPDPQRFPQVLRMALTRRPRRVVDDPTLVCAAVLIPLRHSDRGWCVLITQRTQAVEHHKGQMAFPGGACEPGDVDLQTTALRETYEEIGLPPEAVEVVGALDDVATVSSFVVTPFVGIVSGPVAFRLNPREVEAVVEVPIAFLRDPSQLRVEQWKREGRILDVLFWDYGRYTIWGVSAQILKSLLDLIP